MNGGGALHHFTNGSQSRRRARRQNLVLRFLAGKPGGLSAQAVADGRCEPLRTVKRYLRRLVENGEVQRSTMATAHGSVVIYRAVPHD